MLSSCLGGDYIFYDWDFAQGYNIVGMLLIFFYALAYTCLACYVYLFILFYLI